MSIQGPVLPEEGTLVDLGLEGAEESRVKGHEPSDLVGTSRTSTAETLRGLDVNLHRDRSEQSSVVADRDTVNVQSHLRNAEILDRSLLSDDAENSSQNIPTDVVEKSQIQRPNSFTMQVEDVNKSGTGVPLKRSEEDLSASTDVVAMVADDSIGDDGVAHHQEGAMHHGKAVDEGATHPFDQRFVMSPQEFEEKWMAWTNRYKIPSCTCGRSFIPSKQDKKL